jgi:signal transduction histidine kinase
VGGNDYIMKPFNYLELFARVHNHAMLYAYKKSLQLDLKHTQEENEIQKTVLLQREKMAQMGDAFSMIAHQWKQPLSTIASICTYIEMEEEFHAKLDEEMLGYIKSIGSKVQHLSQTVEVYKKFFKPAHEKEKVAIESIIDDALLIYKDLFVFNHVTVTTDFVSKPYVYVIPNEITQTILILLQNTLDELQSKKIQGIIHIGIKEEGSTVVVEIDDNAGGIPDAIIKDIFKINYTTKGVKGSGIGLYIAKTIVENHHQGTLSVINKGDGAAFTLRIPIV